MHWVMNGFPSMETNATFTELNWKKNTNKKITKITRTNNFVIHSEASCNCDLPDGKLERLIDINGRQKKPDSIDLFDFRPCSLECIDNLWYYHRAFAFSNTTRYVTLFDINTNGKLYIKFGLSIIIRTF